MISLRPACQLLTTSLLIDGASATTGLALNDVVVQKLATGSMMDFETWIDDRYVNTHAGDGIVIASATGSTAYALSCGGPIVEPHLEVLALMTAAHARVAIVVRSTVGDASSDAARVVGVITEARMAETLAEGMELFGD